MSMRILVAHGSKHGATAEIAERIGETLRREGFAVDALPANRAGDPAPYAAVIIGSGVYIGHWRRDAARYLKVNEKALAAKPVWLFSSGPTGEGDPLKLCAGWRIPRGLASVAGRIAPRDVAIFGGAANAGKLNVIERWTMKNVKAPLGDFRDWGAIEAWAMNIAESLKKGR